jgi:hypothetical protein
MPAFNWEGWHTNCLDSWPDQKLTVIYKIDAKQRRHEPDANHEPTERNGKTTELSIWTIQTDHWPNLLD